jgi:hypothetical protein
MSKQATPASSDGTKVRLSVDDVDEPAEDWTYAALALARAETRNASAGYVDREKTQLELWSCDDGEVSFHVRTGPPLSDDSNLTVSQGVDMSPEQAEAFARDLLECAEAAKEAREGTDG